MESPNLIIIFGASDDCKKLINELFPLELCHLIKIVAICDNDSRIHGQSINGYEIISPDNIINYKYDKIIVTPIFFQDIKRQLVDLGVNSEKIYPYRKNYKDYFDTTSREFGNSSIGRFSYFKPNSKIWNTNIGSFCHIGDNCIIGQLGHNPHLISTYPLRYHFSNEISDCSLDPTADKKKMLKTTVIKSDVYIGEGVVISAGVTIGNGAIIGSKALVTKDVEDYSIVGGVPAKIISQRFSSNHIKKLLEIKWWTKDYSQIAHMITDLEGSVDDFINNYFKINKK